MKRRSYLQAVRDIVYSLPPDVTFTGAELMEWYYEAGAKRPKDRFSHCPVFKLYNDIRGIVVVTKSKRGSSYSPHTVYRFDAAKKAEWDRVDASWQAKRNAPHPLWSMI